MVMKGGWWFGSCLIEGVWVMGVAMEGCGYCGSGKCGWKALVKTGMGLGLLNSCLIFGVCAIGVAA